MERIGNPYLFAAFAIYLRMQFPAAFTQMAWGRERNMEDYDPPVPPTNITSKPREEPPETLDTFNDTIAHLFNHVPAKCRSILQYVDNGMGQYYTVPGMFGADVDLTEKLNQERMHLNSRNYRIASRNLDARRQRMLKYSGVKTHCSYNNLNVGDLVHISFRALTRTGLLSKEETENEVDGRPRFAAEPRRVIEVMANDGEKQRYKVDVHTAYGPNKTWINHRQRGNEREVDFYREELCLVTGIQKGTFVRVALTRFSKYRKDIVQSSITSSQKYYAFNHSFTRSIFKVVESAAEEAFAEGPFFLEPYYDASKPVSDQITDLVNGQHPGDRHAAFPLLKFEIEDLDYEQTGEFRGIPASELLPVDQALQDMLSQPDGIIQYHRNLMNSKYKTRVSGTMRLLPVSNRDVYVGESSLALPDWYPALLTCFVDRCANLYSREETWQESALPKPLVPQPNQFEVYDILQDLGDQRPGRIPRDRTLIYDNAMKQKYDSR
jgi:hypothetical protein